MKIQRKHVIVFLRGHCLLVFFLLLSSAVYAQVKSSHDGFYDADSVFYQLTGTGSFKYCINCYNADSLKPYTGGVWLHSREHAPNTWENAQFSKERESGDTNHIRADVVKANTIWVRIYHGNSYTDQHHLVFLGKWKPKTAAVVSILVDSADFMGPHGFYGPGEGMREGAGFRWNYRLKIQKRCSYQVFGGQQWQPEIAQTSGIEVSANYSAIHPDKAIQIFANHNGDKDNFLELGKSLTGVLGKDIKVLRFRVGGANHRTNILANEIAMDIVRPDLGGEHSVPVCLFINGSFWTYAFAEESMGPNHIAKILSTPRSRLTTVRVPVVITSEKLKKTGIELTPLGNSVYSACGFKNVCQLFYIYKDTLQFEIDTADAGYNPAAIDALCNAVKNGTDAQVASIIDREAFYRYALSIWFFQNTEGWARRITLARAGDKPWKAFSEHYDFVPQSPIANDWNEYFADLFNQMHTPPKKTLPWYAAKRMLTYDRDYFCLVMEDELNTTYKPERTVPIAQQKLASLRPCISECSKAWWPNDWPDSVNWESTVSTIVPFLTDRPLGIAAALPKIFMSGADALLTPGSMNQVSVSFNMVQGKDVTVKLNSLELKRNFSGKYYPHPDLRIELVYDRTRYEFVKWQEYPKEPESFRLSAGQNITLTPVLKARKS